MRIVQGVSLLFASLRSREQAPGQGQWLPWVLCGLFGQKGALFRPDWQGGRIVSFAAQECQEHDFFCPFVVNVRHFFMNETESHRLCPSGGNFLPVCGQSCPDSRRLSAAGAADRCSAGCRVPCQARRPCWRRRHEGCRWGWCRWPGAAEGRACVMRD